MVLTALFGFANVAGQDSFNIVYNRSIYLGFPDPGGALGRSVYETADGFMVIGGAVVPGNYGKPFGMHFDPYGSFLGEVEHFGTTTFNYNHGYSDPLWKESAGGTVVITEFSSGTLTPPRQILMRYDDAGDTLWTHVVLDTGIIATRQTCRTSAGQIAACGFSDPDSVPARALLICMDTSGQVAFTRTYPNSVEALGVRPLNVGGYCLSGYQASGVDNGIWVMRLDITGNTVWRRDLGGSYHASKNVSALQTQDGGIVATCSYMPIGSNWNDPQWNYFRKWDIDGNVQWTKQYNQASSATTYDLEELPDGRLVACGNESSHYGLLIELEPDGDLIWLRRYEQYLSNGSIHIPYDVEPTSDGGFVLTGQAKQGPSDSLPYLQMVWLLKVDSMGCLVPGCGNIGVEEIALGLEDALRVYPNPAHGLLNVELSLPVDLQPKGDLQLVLVDALGRVVLQQPIAPPSPPLPTSFTLSLASIPSGVYHLHLRDAVRWLSGTSLVVE